MGNKESSRSTQKPQKSHENGNGKPNGTGPSESDKKCKPPFFLEVVEDGSQSAREISPNNGIKEPGRRSTEKSNLRSRLSPSPTPSPSTAGDYAESPASRKRANSACVGKVILTEYEKALLRKSWSHQNRHGPQNIGIRIYLKILELQPAVKTVFSFGDVADSQLRFNAQFQKQAELFVGVMDGAIRDLNELETSVHRRLFALGKRHASLSRDKFKVSYWDTFAEAMLEVMIEAQGVHSARGLVLAWRKMICWMIEVMRDGFFHAKQKVRSEIRRQHSQRIQNSHSPSHNDPQCPNDSAFLSVQDDSEIKNSPG